MLIIIRFKLRLRHLDEGTQTKRSKIFISIVYLWTGRGPEINNGGQYQPVMLAGPGAVPG